MEHTRKTFLLTASARLPSAACALKGIEEINKLIAGNKDREIQGTIDTLQGQLNSYKSNSAKGFAIRKDIIEAEYKKELNIASTALNDRKNKEVKMVDDAIRSHKNSWCGSRI